MGSAQDKESILPALSRRSWLDWLTRASALTVGGGWLLQCTATTPASPDAPAAPDAIGPRPDGGTGPVDGGSDDESDAPARPDAVPVEDAPDGGRAGDAASVDAEGLHDDAGRPDGTASDTRSDLAHANDAALDAPDGGVPDAWTPRDTQDVAGGDARPTDGTQLGDSRTDAPDLPAGEAGQADLRPEHADADSAAAPEDAGGGADTPDAGPPGPDTARPDATLDEGGPRDTVAPEAVADAGDAGPGDTQASSCPAASSFDAAPSAEYPFLPGASGHPVFDSWPALTVDDQDLARLLAEWRLTVDGLVECPLVLTFEQIVNLPRQRQVTDLHCGDGWSVFDIPWVGVRLSEIVSRARPLPGATHVTARANEGIFRESFLLSVAMEPRTLLAYGAAGAPLPLGHGFPARIVIPRYYGYKSVKYVTQLEITDQPVAGYWVESGYPDMPDVDPARLREGKY